MCEEVAEMMAVELGYSDDWVKSQIKDFKELAKGYYLE